MKMDTSINHRNSDDKPPLREGLARSKSQTNFSLDCSRRITSVKVKRDGTETGKDVKKSSRIFQHHVKTPLASKAPLFKTPSPTNSEEKSPSKRHFSKGVLGMSLSQSKTGSKGTICLLPPKRIGLDDFHYVRTDVRYTTCVREDQRKPELKRLKPQEPMRWNKNGSSDEIFAGKRSTPGGGGKRKGRNVSHFLVSVDGFPHEEWKKNNVELLMKFLSTPNSIINPVTIESKDGQLIVHFEKPKICSFAMKRRPPSKVSVAGVMFAVSTLPLTLTVRAFAGVVKWILGR